MDAVVPALLAVLRFAENAIRRDPFSIGNARPSAGLQGRIYWTVVARRKEIALRERVARTRRYNLNALWRQILSGDKAWIARQRQKAAWFRIKIRALRRFAREETRRERRQREVQGFQEQIRKRSERRRLRIEELSDRIERRFLAGEERLRRTHLAAKAKALRKLDTENRKAIENAARLDWNFRDSLCSLHSFIPDYQPDPLHALMLKEEREEERKYEKYRARKHRPLPVYRPHDFTEERFGRLISSAPAKPGRRGKFRGGTITKFSPERGITQRHVKMSPQQFV